MAGDNPCLAGLFAQLTEGQSLVECIVTLGGKAMRADNAADCAMHRINMEKGHRFAAADLEEAKRLAAEKRKKRRSKVEEERELGVELLAAADAKLQKEKNRKEGGGVAVARVGKRKGKEGGGGGPAVIQVAQGETVVTVEGEMVRLLDACQQVQGRTQRAAEREKAKQQKCNPV